MNNIYAGIISYNPDIDRLKDNISSVLKQVQGLIVVDNASDNIDEIKRLLSEIDKESRIELIVNNKNMGIGYALNQIMKNAHDKKTISWVLTLDQDTVVYDDIIKMYQLFLNSDNKNDDIVSLTCLRHDRNFVEKNANGNAKSPITEDFTEVKSCITSGNLISVDAWKKIKGFNNSLFIDMVDDEFCYRLREHNYKIIRINKYGYMHELGDSVKKVRFLMNDKNVFIYSAKRKYYVARNCIYMMRRYKLGIINEYSRYLIKRILATLLYEKNKIHEISAYIKGIKAGFKLKCTK